MDQIKIKSFATEMEAELAKGMLGAYGIKSLVQCRGVHSSGISDDRFGAELFVLQTDVEKAKEILELSEK